MFDFLSPSKLKIIIGLMGLFLLSTGISYAIFSFLNKEIALKIVSPVGTGGQQKVKVDTSAPKTEECPLNGKLYTKAEKDIWSGRRPLGVMIENHEDSRPQSGLSKADVVYEAIAEGGITRFLAVYYCGASAEEIQIGPIRSARTYFMDWVSEYGDHPLYAHVGGANRLGPADALGQIEKYGWKLYNDMNQFSIGYPTYWKDPERFGHEVATEHTMYSTTEKLWKVSEERGLTDKDKKGNKWDEDFISWRFADGKPLASPEVTNITFPFWAGYTKYAVSWSYDSSTNSYKRDNGGEPHKDMNSDEQISASGVVVLFTKAKGPIDEWKHMLYDTIGRGKILVFQNGQVVEGNWKKDSRTARTKFTDQKGKDITFARGQIWIEALDPTTKVEY